MTRHSKNNTANPIFTYHERKKVKDFNTLKQRLGGDSMRKCEQCWLCLSTAIKPVCTPLGYLFCKECILTCFAKQMEDYKRQLQAWELSRNQVESKKKRKMEEESHSQKRRLITESVYGVAPVKSRKNKDSGPHERPDNQPNTGDSNFWVSGVPGTEKHETKATDSSMPSQPKPGTVCPITGKPLKLKHLIDIRPDTSRESDETSSGVIWICSISQKPISHQPAVVDRETGKVTLKRYIAVPEDTSDSQYISLIPGGTGFSAHNTVSAKRYRPALL